MAVKVFKLDDVEWWAGESLQACIDEARAQAGEDCYEFAGEDGYELSDALMQSRRFTEDDGTQRSFAEQLQLLISEGATFPCLFAATEW